MRALASVLFVLLTSVAGCSGGGGGDGDDLVDEKEFEGLSATDTTGVIRGVVVDIAVHPLAGAVITIVSSGKNTTSAESGAFGFDGLQGGTYFLQVSMAGFQPVQQSVDVVAGVAEPDIVKVQLMADPGQKPFHELYSWQGFIQCSTRFFVNAVAGACPDDNTTYRLRLDTVPTFAQSEMLYDSTQAAGNGLRVEYTDDTDGYDNYVIADGASPLVISANQTLMTEKHAGDGKTGLYIRVFAGTVKETQTPTCIPTTPCYGGSVIVNQKFDVFTVLFYNYLPPEGWQFSIDGEPQDPA
jgi:hypothetical protein